MAENLEIRAGKAVLQIKKKVDRIYDVLRDVGMKLTHVIEYKFDYYSMPKGIDYGEFQ